MRSLPYPALQLVGLGKLNKEGRDEWSSLLNADAISSALTAIACDRQHAIVFQHPTRVRFLEPHLCSFEPHVNVVFMDQLMCILGYWYLGGIEALSLCVPFTQVKICDKIYNKCNCLKRYWKLCWRVNSEKGMEKRIQFDTVNGA